MAAVAARQRDAVPFGVIVKRRVRRESIKCSNQIIAVGAINVSKGVDAVAKLIVHVRNEHHDAELFADYLLNTLIRLACETAPAAIDLVHLPGQSIVSKLAIAHGFRRSPNAPIFSKVAIGRPVTANAWPTTIQQVRRRTGLVLPNTLSALSSDGEIDVRTPKGATVRISAVALEDLLGPTLFMWPGRDGVIVPITRSYADELLGTAVQANLGFCINRDAAFLSRRGYVNAPRTAKQMRAGMPVVFYESMRTGKGRGAAVAVARIVNSVLVAKSQLDAKSDKRLVVDSVESFSSTKDVLVTTFDNLMAFPTPVGFSTLKKFNATGGTNLVSAVSLSGEQITSILTHGWSGGRAR